MGEDRESAIWTRSWRHARRPSGPAAQEPRTGRHKGLFVELAAVEGPTTASSTDHLSTSPAAQFIGDFENLFALITSECTTGLKAV